ncbi:hypothetical protein [Aureibacillus halotolerans]|uniref:mRNA-degrading endonuclease RelE of RelBE toxin-antitoxin system n=1 Tax=Aureibacillus halotolerans TaxID=1508390 RepID=A0A4R6TYH5_9BACI|nr:hypothetical protein [Aureibacillus halotolerans]TDQ36985.1 mRNA-degrading endonuclease RelE of RelBE toxin-antitoxin system [Aureibacillus halotolerans]
MNHYQIIPTKSFDRALRNLTKKHPKAVDDIGDVLTSLQNGDLVGNAIPGLKHPNNKAFKVRSANVSGRTGKRGGFRIIYYLVTSDNEIYLLTVYSKSDKQNISTKEINELVRKYVKPL